MSKNYRPLPDCVTIAESPKLEAITGKRELGMFATEDIVNGTVIGITHIYNEDYEDDYIRTPLGGFANQFDYFNIAFVNLPTGHIVMEAITDIKAGDELSAKYTLYDPTL